MKAEIAEKSGAGFIHYPWGMDDIIIANPWRYFYQLPKILNSPEEDSSCDMNLQLPFTVSVSEEVPG